MTIAVCEGLLDAGLDREEEVQKRLLIKYLQKWGRKYPYAGYGACFGWWIMKKDLTNPEVYKKANMDRKLFSKILNHKDYKPSKVNALALAIALELNLDETKDFIGRAGYALTHSSKFDVIIEWFIEQEKYNIFEIYNGPGKEPWGSANMNEKHSYKMIQVSKLVALDQMVKESERISKQNDIEKYKRVSKTVNVQREDKKTSQKKQNGKTLVQGYINRNNQENKGCTGEEGSHAGQLFYLMKCLNCGFEYKSNGCDVWLRKCPHCM